MTLSGYYYHCSAGETFDIIALEIYGNEKYAAELLCANPALSDTLIFTGGEAVALPVIEIPDDDEIGSTVTTAPWKE